MFAPGEIYLYLVGARKEWRHCVSYYDSVVFDSRCSKKGHSPPLFWFKKNFNSAQSVFKMSARLLFLMRMSVLLITLL